MAPRITGALVGVVFGVTLSWTGMTSPEVIRSALLFEKAYLFLFFGAAVATAFVGLRVLRAVRGRAVIPGDPVRWTTSRPERRHVVGSVIFGIGWAVSDACPGPMFTQLGQGIAWSLFTIAGVAIGVRLYAAARARRTAPAAAGGGGGISLPQSA